MAHESVSESRLFQNNLDTAVFVGDQAVHLIPAEQQLVSYAPTILGPIYRDVLLKEGGTGTEGDIHWNRTELLGKQQPVALVDITLPGGSVIPVVFRPSWSKFREAYEQYPAVRELFPKLYMSANVPYYEDTTREVLVVEKLSGYHGDHHDKSIVDEYNSIVDTDEGFEQMCQESFQAIDKIHELPFAIWDLAPLAGHNVIYNTATHHFQLFDVDILHPSDEPNVQKFMRLIDSNIQMHDLSDLNVKYAMRMIQLYAEAHLVSDFSYEEPIDLAVYATTDEMYPAEGTVLYSGTEDYEEAYRRIAQGEWSWLGSRALGRGEDYPSFVKSIKHGLNVTKIDPDMLAAIKASDVDGFKALLLASDRPNYKKLMKTEFVEV